MPRGTPPRSRDISSPVVRQFTIRNADDLLTPAQAENFSVGDIAPSTWGEAMDLRIGRQGEMSGAPSDWAERFPNGSIYDPHIVE